MLLAPTRNRWLCATAQVGIEVTATSDREITYQSLAMSLMTALRLRGCLVTARDRHPPKRDHVSMAMVRINRHLPDGSPSYASQYKFQKGPERICIADSADGPHETMHSVVACSGDQITVVRGHEDPLVKRINPATRFVDEWVGKTSFFVCWYDERPVPLAIASFGTRGDMDGGILQDLESPGWNELYHLIGQRLLERNPDPLPLEGLPERNLEMLECLARDSVEEGMKRLNVTRPTYNRRRRALARKLGIPVEHLPTEAVKWMLKA